VVPDLGKEKHLTGTIVSVGPGYHCATGEFVASTLKVGQKVILPQMGPTKIEFEGEEYYGTLENQVIAIIND
jgi:co-chaperonin GroES (HSP10)